MDVDMLAGLFSQLALKTLLSSWWDPREMWARGQRAWRGKAARPTPASLNASALPILESLKTMTAKRNLGLVTRILPPKPKTPWANPPKRLCKPSPALLYTLDEGSWLGRVRAAACGATTSAIGVAVASHCSATILGLKALGFRELGASAKSVA